jgi:hypothetical protein
MSDLVLLIIDKVKVFAQNRIQTGQTRYDEKVFERLVDPIKHITPENSAEHE